MISEKDLLVIKVGTSTLVDTDGDRMRLNSRAFCRIGRELREITTCGVRVILVSSGAVSTGLMLAGKGRQGVSSCDLGDYARRGWREVADRWGDAIGSSCVGSALLTRRDLVSELLSEMASQKGVFVLNEDDVSSDIFGNNDTMASRLATGFAELGTIDAVRLVMLTNAHGLYRVPRDASTIVRRVDNFDEVLRYAADTESPHGRGGMATKVDAARHASGFGVASFIAHGREESAVRRALDGEIGTAFEVNSATIK